MKIDILTGNRNLILQMRIETLAVHAGHSIDPATGAVSAPIHLSTTFERDMEGGYPRGFMHAREIIIQNRQALEQGVSALEGGGGRGGVLLLEQARPCRFLVQALAPGDHVPGAS